MSTIKPTALGKSRQYDEVLTKLEARVQEARAQVAVGTSDRTMIQCARAELAACKEVIEVLESICIKHKVHSVTIKWKHRKDCPCQKNKKRKE